MEKEDEIRVEQAWNQMIADAGYTEKEFLDEISYWNYLQDKLIIANDCSNQFAYRGTSNCDSNCVHVRAVAAAMEIKLGGVMENK